ncbi:MAG TPA: TPM domain-containing protein [Flavobacterium sp.]|jgi:uncharacterized membrane protein
MTSLKGEKFLSPEDEEQVVEAIRKAEKETSGEIRVHIEKTCPSSPLARAGEVFNLLAMDETELRNGVLIYVATDDHLFYICGDKGINDVVAPDFWDCTKDVMASHFKNRDFKQGLIEGIQRAGEQLRKHFPPIEGDKDELTNEISNG